MPPDEELTGDCEDFVGFDRNLDTPAMSGWHS